VLSELSAALLSALLSVPVVVSATALLSALAALSLAASLFLPVLPCEQAGSHPPSENHRSGRVRG